jgi:hypothetical protein
MKIKSFGCSFIFGNDLSDDGRDGPYATPSNLTWPALIAKQLGAEYKCYARGGIGNLHIAERVLKMNSDNKVNDPDDICIIGWTWIDRFDYIVETDGPHSFPSIMPIDTSDVAKYYYRHLHSEHRDKMVSLMYIYSTIQVLLSRNIKFVMTYMDDLLFDEKWNTSPALVTLQALIKPYMTTFENKNFLAWSREKGFPISKTLHPLEPAHAAAAEIMLPTVQRLV